MKTDRKILVAFILNIAFSVFEFLGGVFTGSIAITSDALHDFGDAVSIGLAYFLENKSKKRPDDQHTYGYVRYSVLGGAITNLILVQGSLVVVYNAVNRMFNPTQIHHNGMIMLAVIGVCVNLAAVYFTHDGDSLNRKAVNLHMLEDVLGWLAVLVGAVVMRFTAWYLVDPILSIGVALFILVEAVRNFRQILDLFLEKTPDGIHVHEMKEQLLELDGVSDVHHVHVWSLDGHNHYATMHLVVNTDVGTIKEKVRGKLREHGIGHVTLEFETVGEHCHEPECSVRYSVLTCHDHHH